MTYIVLNSTHSLAYSLCRTNAPLYPHSLYTRTQN